jgi:hypothetical protein
MENNDWKNYRNRWVFLKGKKIKLRSYIYVSANYMHQKNKNGWQNVNHVQNYKAALNKYGLDGLQIYEDYYHKNIPLPEQRSLKVKIAVFLAPYYSRLLNFNYKEVKQFFKDLAKAAHAVKK